MDDERWRPVPGFEGAYAVSDHGRVQSLNHVVIRTDGKQQTVHGRVLARPVGARGYMVVNIKNKPRYIHQLVLAAFVGPLPSGMHVRHLSGDKLDNRLVNLRYGTPKENSRDTVLHGGNTWAAKTRCPQQHEYTPENTIVSTRGDGRRFRICRACNYARNRAAYRNARSGA